MAHESADPREQRDPGESHEPNESQDAAGSPHTEWFTFARFGMFVHFGAYSVAARHEWVQSREQLSAERYRRYVDNFDPDLFDADELARLAVRAGCRYLVLTTKHHDGFCLWNSRLTDYSTGATIGRDLVREYVDAARRAGLRVGLYHSLLDWHHPDFTVDRFHPDRGGDVAALNRDRDMARYREYLHGQVRELLSDYGPIDLLFYDFSYPGDLGEGDAPGNGAFGEGDRASGVLRGKGAEDWGAEALLAETRALQPGIVVNNRLGIPGDYETPEQVQPTRPRTAGGQPVVWEACHTLNGSWGYDRDNVEFKDPLQLVTMLVRSVALGGNLILNVGPNGRGEIRAREREILESIGDWMRLHESAVRGCGPAEFAAPVEGVYTQRGRRLYLHVLSWPLQLLNLPGLAGRVEFARFLHDGSEIAIREAAGPGAEADNMSPDAQPEGVLTVQLPIMRPDVLVPVIELTLREGAL